MAARARRARGAERGARAAVLTLDAAVYSDEALEKAREAFADLATIEVRRAGRRQVVRFTRIEPAAAGLLVDEFANYALSCLVVPS